MWTDYRHTRGELVDLDHAGARAFKGRTRVPTIHVAEEHGLLVFRCFHNQLANASKAPEIIHEATTPAACRLFTIILGIGILVLLVLPASSRETDLNLLFEKADHFFMLYDYWSAQPLYAQAEALCARTGDKRNELYAKISQYPADPGALSLPDMSRYLDKALRDPLVMNDRRLRLRCLIVKGTLNSYFDVPSAEHIWREVQQLASALNDSTWRARASTELSIAAFLNADYPDAVKLIAGAIHDAEVSGDQAGLVRAFSLLARGLGELGRNEEAVGYADQALNRAASTNDLPYPATVYAAKIQGLIGLKRLAEARALLSRSMAQVHDRLYFYPDLAVDAGILAEAEGKLSQAAKLYTAAADLCARYGIPGYYGNALARLTRLYVDMGQLEKAEQSIMRGIDSNRKVGDVFVLPIRLALAADIKLRLGKRSEASELLDEATDISEAMLVNAPTVTLKSSLVNFLNDLYVSQFKLAAESPEAAFRVIEKARASATAQTIRTGREATGSESIERQLAQVQYKLFHARTSTERKNLLLQLFRTEHQLSPTLLGYSQQSVTDVSRPASTLAAIQGFLRTDETILEYILAEPASFCLAITRGGAHLYALAGRKQIEQAVDKFVGTLIRKESALGLSKEVYRLLLDPIPEVELNGRYIIIPDGKLDYLPFETLVEPNGRFLLELHTVSYATSSSFLQSVRNSTRAPAPVAFLGVGALRNDTWDMTVNKQQMASVRSSVKRGVFDENGTQLAPLPAGLKELLSGAELAGTSSKLLLGDRATETAFKQLQLDQYQVIHIVAHTSVDASYPDRSAIILSESNSSADDGLLQAREIRRIRLNSELVAIPACDTAVGRLEGQAGVVSLMQAFLLAGSKSVLGTLWSVEDAATESVMSRFYFYLSAGLDKGASLQRAKIDFLNRYKGQIAPFYWGGLVLSGDSTGKIRF
jgi:CHAT domain-containing protein/tetratricopeptide (TPR) repeat protein